MCKQMNVNLSPLPVSTLEEYKMFNSFMLKICSQNTTPKFDNYKELAVNYLNMANGTHIFPKNINMLQKHFKKWHMNQDNKNFAQKIQKHYEKLQQKLSAQRIPPPKTRIFSVTDSIPPKIQNIVPVGKDNNNNNNKIISKKESEVNIIEKHLQKKYIQMAKPCVR